jgi:hypothetical protein
MSLWVYNCFTDGPSGENRPVRNELPSLTMFWSPNTRIYREHDFRARL